MSLSAYFMGSTEIQYLRVWVPTWSINLAIYSYLDNKLLLISINFTPKTSHSCLNISKMRLHFFFAFLDHVHNFHDHGIEQSPTAHPHTNSAPHPSELWHGVVRIEFHAVRVRVKLFSTATRPARTQRVQRGEVRCVPKDLILPIRIES